MMDDDGCVKAEQRPARLPDRSGAASRDGVSLHYDMYGDDIHGDAATTVMLLPTWSVVPSRFWKAQVAFLARHYRVITFDGRGTGRSSRPRGAAAFADREFAADALAVLDATETERAVLVGFSCGATWAVHLAAAHPERALGVVAIAPACGLRITRPDRRTCPLAKRLSTIRRAGRNTPGTTGCTVTWRISGSSISPRCSPSRIPPNRSRTALLLVGRDRCPDVRRHHRRAAGRRRADRAPRRHRAEGAVPGPRGARDR